MSENILITGGAGFIGSHLADSLLSLGHKVTIYDNLHPQVHGREQKIPAYLSKDVHFILGDIRDASNLQKALTDKTIVFHFAAHTGVGQSMYQIKEYMDVNVQGTAVLMDLLSQNRQTIRKIILASSRAVYGEGLYSCTNCGQVHPDPRSTTQLQQGNWELHCPHCEQNVTPLPTSEETTLAPSSIYALGKQVQEQLCQLVEKAYGIPTVILRYFNVYGPRQSLKNPYTGVINVFLTRLLNGKPPQVYEDGQELRDFVHVHDVIRACLSSMKKETANGQIINVGTGVPLSLLQIAQIISDQFNGPSPVISGQFRVGDIRHCYADISKAKNLLDYTPHMTFTAGIRAYIEQIIDQHWDDLSAIPEQELQKHGLSASRL